MFKIPLNLGAPNINLTTDYLQEGDEDPTQKFRGEEEMHKDCIGLVMN